MMTGDIIIYVDQNSNLVLDVDLVIGFQKGITDDFVHILSSRSGLNLFYKSNLKLQNNSRVQKIYI